MSKKHAFKGVFCLAAAIFGLVLVGGLFTPAQATHIGCNALLLTIHEVLDSDVGPCSGPDPAIAVPGTLDMAGFTVSCFPDSDAGDGIRLLGPKVVVTNGIVTGCATGFRIVGNNNKLTGTTADHNFEGFIITGNKNTLTGNLATNNLDIGFDVSGNHNKLIHNTAKASAVSAGFVIEFDASGANDFNTLDHNLALGNEGDGFIIDSSNNILKTNFAIANSFGFNITGESNTLTHNHADTGTNHSDGFNLVGFEISGNNNILVQGNTAKGNLDDGFNIDGAFNTLTGNTATKNGNNGFDINDDNNTLTGNHAIGNGGDGFDIDGANTTLTGNTASGNGDSQNSNAHNGFNIQTSFNTLTKNIATGNLDHGFRIIFGEIGNHVIGNTATGNIDTDLRDGNDECSSNTWSGNHFGTKDPACIR